MVSFATERLVNRGNAALRRRVESLTSGSPTGLTSMCAMAADRGETTES
jgi:hypothetical protein